MMSLFRNSRSVATAVACLRRTAATTSTPGGGTKVQPSGASADMSEASRVADETYLATKNAEQRGNPDAADATKPKATTSSSSQASGGQSASPAKGTQTSSPWGKIAFAVILTGAGYFVYTNFIKNPGVSQTLYAPTDAGKKGAYEKSLEHSGSTSKKH